MKALDHIAIYVDDIAAGISFYSALLDGEPVVAQVPELGITCAFFAPPSGPAIELVSFTGTGELRHGDVVVAIEVDDLDAALAGYRAQGLKVYDQPPTENLPLRRGWITKAHGHGTIIELCPAGAVAAFIANRRRAVQA